MNLFIYTLGAILGFSSISIHAQVAVDSTIAASAQAAVQKLGLEMMKENFSYGNQRIYPRWKRRLAKRQGGMAQLDAALARSAQQNTKLGFHVTAYRADMPTSFFSVWRAKKIDPNTGKPLKNALGKEFIVEHWLAVVPTVTRVKIPDPNKGGQIRELEEKGYVIVITEKGENNWYFLTGLKPTINDLRSLFPTLPRTAKELGIPTARIKKIK